jgi:hypothetical protein
VPEERLQPAVVDQARTEKRLERLVEDGCSNDCAARTCRPVIWPEGSKHACSSCHEMWLTSSSTVGE